MGVEAVLKEAREWVGVPYRFGACDKKRGVDCVQFITECYKIGGFIPPGYEVPVRNPFWFEETNHGAPEDFFRKEPLKFATPINPENRRLGDAITFRLMHIEVHVGIMDNNDTFIHATRGRGVMINDYKHFKNKVAGAYRFGTK